MKMYIGGEWVDRDEKINVLNPYDGSVIDTVPSASLNDLETALATAVRGAEAMKQLSGYQRFEILRKAADIMRSRIQDLGTTVSTEEGKILAEGLAEADRAIQTIELSGEEAKRLYGETVPLDGASNWAGQYGFTMRVPVGVVAAIAPFNFPLNLVAHKVGPALAAGNAVIIKPATDTPLSALKLTEVLIEAGAPPEAVQCITGSGSRLGDPLVADSRVRKVTFTGSRDVGETICKTAGLKKVTMELGSNSPVIVLDDADPEKVAATIAVTGFANAGQVCISTQRVFASSEIYGDFIDALKPTVEALTTGNPLDENVSMGPMIRVQDAERVEAWVQEAVSTGASIVTGGTREGTMHAPTILADVAPEMKVSCDEIFGPALGISPIDDIDQAIAMANDTNYGLSAAIFTENLNNALQFAQQVESGNIHILSLIHI